MSENQNRARRRTIAGVVTSHAMDKTIVVETLRPVQHPLFKKYIRRRTRIHAHDEANEARAGDRVEVMECRPLSKTKHFRLVRIIERPKLASSTPGEDLSSLEGISEQ